MKLLHETMKDYEEWVLAAPEHYKDDGYLLNHVPITVSCRYGQNILMGDTPAAIEHDKTCSYYHPNELCNVYPLFSL